MTYLRALTSLRFFAALLIIVHHTHGYFGYGTSAALGSMRRQYAVFVRMTLAL